MSETSYHCAECQEGHFSITHDLWLKREMAEIKSISNNKEVDKEGENDAD